MQPRIEVLLCEDDDASARLVQLALERDGVHVTRVSSGVDAWEKLQASVESGTSSYDSVLLDWMLPGMDGPEVLRRFRERFGRSEQGGGTPRFIGFSARSQNDQERSGFHPDAWLAKPFDLDDLRNLIQGFRSSHRRSPLSDPALQAAIVAYREDLLGFAARLTGILQSTSQEELARLLHTLAGTAPSYGFQALGAAAEGVERLPGSSRFGSAQLKILEAEIRSAIASYDAESVRVE